MGYNTDDLELASPFQPFEGEANFGPPLTREVKGGVHIAPHAIITDGKRLAMVVWTNGLPRHDSSNDKTIRFPHGLMVFGETFEECASRLTRNQSGLSVVKARLIHAYSYVDEDNHWHIEPLILSKVEGGFNPPAGVEDIIWFEGPELPLGGTWRGKPPFENIYNSHIVDALSHI